jgi:SAM-dependent methyltransferase
VLRQLLPAATPGSVLEVASGTGQHVAHFAAAFPQLSWQPSDVTAECFDSIRAHAGRRLANVRPPVVLDAAAPAQAWPCQGPLAAVYAANVSHISPWRVTLGLLAGAGQLLQPGGLLCLYGPFKINGAFTSESNESFHHTLRAQDPQWGYRDVADIEAAARGAGLALQRRVDMPANNHLLVFVKQPGASGG